MNGGNEFKAAIWSIINLLQLRLIYSIKNVLSATFCCFHISNQFMHPNQMLWFNIFKTSHARLHLHLLAWRKKATVNRVWLYQKPNHLAHEHVVPFFSSWTLIINTHGSIFCWLWHRLAACYALHISYGRSISVCFGQMTVTLIKTLYTSTSTQMIRTSHSAHMHLNTYKLICIIALLDHTHLQML